MVDLHRCTLALLPVPEPDHATAPHPDPASVPAGAWEPLEAAARAVVGRIQPTSPSEARRAAVVDYVQRLVRRTVRCEVFPFGSVPLKTYLPDGDIDLTAFGSTISAENLANEVCAVLESEGRRKDAEFEVKDVQYINAEVKLVKCLVQNIVVDISFNQIGGLCTLCFLEQVDQRFEKTHLFKRSIMLIKAWCYYESRILGAHHGLISTYALEILVIYILHLFHESLDGPLAVLYRFLDYYSKFDWDNKGISLYGPVSLSSLPDLVTDPPDSQDDVFLKQEEFLKECAQIFTVPTRNFEKHTRVFSRKFLNIVDPLKHCNNLGRSVSKGNFYRIRSAFDLGAQKLGTILQMPTSSTMDEVNKFFRNTLKRNHTRVRPDMQDISLDFNVERSNKGSPLFNNNSYADLSDQFNTISISDSNDHGSLKQNTQNSMAEHKEMNPVSNPVTTHSISTRNGNDYEATPSTSITCSLPCERGYDAPHPVYKSENGNVDANYGTNLSQHGSLTEGYTDRSCHYIESTKYGNENLIHPVDCLRPIKEADKNNFQVKEVGGDRGTTSNNVLDLTGDYITNLNNLFYAQGCHQDYPVNQFYYQMLPPPHVQYQNTSSPNGLSRNNAYGYAVMNGIVPSPYPPGYFVFRPHYQTDESMRARGTGTYFPDPNLCKDRPPAGRGERGRNHFPLNNYHRPHRYGRVDMPIDMTPSEDLRQEPPMQIYSPGANIHGIPSPMRMPVPYPSFQASQDIINGNGFIDSQPQDTKLEFGTLGLLDVRGASQHQAKPLEVRSNIQDQANVPNSASNSQPSAPLGPMSSAQNSGLGSNQIQKAKPYHLKDNGDFPPLSN